MKKKVIYGLLSMLALSYVSFTASASNDSKSILKQIYAIGSKAMASYEAKTSADVPQDAKTITVYVIVGTNASVSKSAYYSPSENRIYINEGKHMMNYNIYENPQYGQDSAKGRFKYRAGDYFFDL